MLENRTICESVCKCVFQNNHLQTLSWNQVNQTSSRSVAQESGYHDVRSHFPLLPVIYLRVYFTWLKIAWSGFGMMCAFLHLFEKLVYVYIIVF